MTLWKSALSRATTRMTMRAGLQHDGHGSVSVKQGCLILATCEHSSLTKTRQPTMIPVHSRLCCSVPKAIDSLQVSESSLLQASLSHSDFS